MPTLKTLQPGDEAALEAFLCQHVDTSMFLRSNLRMAGLADEGKQFQATYVAAIESGRAIAVAAHCWNGMILVQAPVYLKEVVLCAVTSSRRTITGITGPAPQVRAAVEALGLADRPTSHSGKEVLFSLALSDLRVPKALSEGEVQCRLPTTEELDLLTEWSAAYNVETLGRADTPDLRTACRQTLEGLQARGMHWVLVAEDTLVSYSAFNACLPDIVQIGGVWTPHEWRDRGYAKSVVAGSLISARSQGVNRAILFTQANNQAAQAVYRGIGFQSTGEEYGLLLF